MSVEWESALLVKCETFTAPLTRHLVGLFKIVAKEINESLMSLKLRGRSALTTQPLLFYSCDNALNVA